MLGSQFINALKNASTDESKVLYHKTKADYYHYIAELKIEDAKKAAAEEARRAYNDASRLASAALPATHPIRLGLALEFSVFQYRVLDNSEEACKTARTAFEAAFWTLFHVPDNVSEDSYKDSKVIMQRLLEKISFWSCDQLTVRGSWIFEP